MYNNLENPFIFKSLDTVLKHIGLVEKHCTLLGKKLIGKEKWS